MRWGTLWLTAVMIAASSGADRPQVVTVENIPISLDPSTSNSMITGGQGQSGQPTGTTDEGEESVGTAVPGTTTCEDGDDQCAGPPEGENGSSTTDPPDDDDNGGTTTPEDDNGTPSTTAGGSTPSTTEGGSTPSTTEGGSTDTTTDQSPPEDCSSTDECTSEVEPNEELIIKTKSGKVQGFLWQEKEYIISYIDIPYGTFDTKPFEAATAAKAWDMHSVIDHDKECPQIRDNKYVGNMDCLTLSIFKPQIATNASVLFYIHGDDFKTGSGDPSIYGPDYLVSRGIILVLPNYRLGPLGFLCMQNKTAPGNMALKDLSLALSWIHDNIHSFGGNPNNIVVGGDGRSGALAEFLALSSMSKNYVDKVISESGSFLSHWALDRDPQSTINDFFDRIQEADKSIKSRIDISLEDLDFEAIVNAANEIEFKPCLEAKDDESFMTETPFAIITTEKIITTFLMGSAMYAGYHEALHQTEDSVKELNEDFTMLLPNDLTFPTMTVKGEIGGRVKRQYFGDQNITLENMRNITLYFTDVAYLSPGIRSARLLAEAGATVYFYEFSFVGEFNRDSKDFDSPAKGAVRGDIVRYLFTQDSHVPDDDTDEAKMVDTLTKLWINFMIEGHPATETISWTKLENDNHDEEEWLLIDSDEPSMQKGLHVDRLALWTNIYEEHFIEGTNHAQGLTPAVLTVLIFQIVFWLVFCTNVSHVF